MYPVIGSSWRIGCANLLLKNVKFVCRRRNNWIYGLQASFCSFLRPLYLLNEYSQFCQLHAFPGLCAVPGI